jgi:hypothetical protein
MVLKRELRIILSLVTYLSIVSPIPIVVLHSIFLWYCMRALFARFLHAFFVVLSLYLATAPSLICSTPLCGEHASTTHVLPSPLNLLNLLHLYLQRPPPLSSMGLPICRRLRSTPMFAAIPHDPSRISGNRFCCTAGSILELGAPDAG